jgi:hypothetical protein
MRKICLIFVLTVSLAWNFLAAASDCTKTTVGMIPLTDLGQELYKNRQGGLYPNGLNVRPLAHETAGLALADSVEPLDSAGQPNPTNGRIVLLSIGMSNTNQEFSVFKRIADADRDKNPRLLIVNGAQGGQDATRVADPNAMFWQRVDELLSREGATRQQVQAVWLKQAIAGPREPFPADAQRLQGLLQTIVQILNDRFPNLKLVYLSSRIYAGYADRPLNPEPYAYQSGFAVKWLIEDQINGKPELNFDPAKGPVRAPWLAWGPYLWADGLSPRSDGLIWECSDLRDDGTHPSASGQMKVAQLLLNFFKTDSTTTSWFFE